MSSLETLLKYAASDNVAEYLDDEDLNEIADRVIEDYKIDEDSMIPWMERSKNGMEIALQLVKEKTFPWQGAANVKFPLITNGAITFASREYPQLVRGNTVVETTIIGKDPDGSKARKASRQSKYMSWQLLEDSDEWESDTDKLLVMLAVVGTVFRKAYYDPILNKPVFDLCRPDHIVVNDNIKNIEKARRITHKLYMYDNDLVERMRLGLFSEYDIEKLEHHSDISSPDQMLDVRDQDRPHFVLEQHRFWDLDGDGYAEPYIVTVHVDSRKVLRIKSRFSIENVKFNAKKQIQYIRPIQYFTDFHFLPSPNGKFFSLGFGNLLYPLNHSINTVLNQILDSGTLANMQTGFLSSSCRIKSGELFIAPGRWNKLEGVYDDISSHVQGIPVHDPSNVLFELLGLLINIGKELASVSDILQGNQPTQNSPATTVLALIKQGLVQYNAIHKRVLRAFKKEFDKLYYLNCLYLDEIGYINMINDEEASKDDFDLSGFAVRPVADPNMASDMQRMQKVEAIAQRPGLNLMEVNRQYLEAIEAENIEALMQQQPPGPQDQLIMAQAENEKADAQSKMLDHKQKAAELEIKVKQQQIDMANMQMQMAKMNEEIKNITETRSNIQADTILKLHQADKAKEEAKHAGDKPAAGTSNK